MDPLACPDVLAERRYAYGQSALAEGDAEAAADLFEQTLERAPDWAPAWFALGEARQKLDDAPGAAKAFRRALEADARDRLGAGLRLALLEGRPVAALPESYVARLFDDYAPRFDSHLRERLGYRGPELIAATLDRVAPGRRFARALDLGCGSGLAAPLLRARTNALAGVDLSPRMIALAKATGLYDTLDVADLVAFLQAQAPASADLAAAVDALVYIGDLTPAFQAAAAALKPGGLFVFTVERGEAAFALSDKLRFRHSESHLRAAAEVAGLTLVHCAEAAVRREAGVQANSLVAAFAK